MFELPMMCFFHCKSYGLTKIFSRPCCKVFWNLNATAYNWSCSISTCKTCCKKKINVNKLHSGYSWLTGKKVWHKWYENIILPFYWIKPYFFSQISLLSFSALYWGSFVTPVVNHFRYQNAQIGIQDTKITCNGSESLWSGTNSVKYSTQIFL